MAIAGEARTANLYLIDCRRGAQHVNIADVIAQRSAVGLWSNVTKSEPGAPMTLDNAMAAGVRLIVWCSIAAIRSSPPRRDG